MKFPSPRNTNPKLTMKLKELMTRNPVSVRPDAPVREAAKKMREFDCGLLPVSEGDRLCGMITDRDLTIRVTAEGLDADAMQVGDVMTPEIVHGFEDQDVHEGIETMEKARIRRLIVLDGDHKLAGIVALADLATRTREEHEKAEVLEAVSS